MQSITGADFVLNLDILGASRYIASTINELPNNSGVAETKKWMAERRHRQYPCRKLSFAVGAVGQCDAAGVISNFGGDWFDCVAVNYWYRFVLNLDILGANRCIASTINEFPCNGGVAKTKSRRKNRGTREVLVAVVFSFRGGNSQSNTASIVGNFGSDWLDCVAVNYWCRLILNLNTLGASRWVLLPTPSTNFHVMVVSPRPKSDGRTAVPAMSLSQLSFALGAVRVKRYDRSCR